MRSDLCRIPARSRGQHQEENPHFFRAAFALPTVKLTFSLFIIIPLSCCIKTSAV